VFLLPVDRQAAGVWRSCGIRHWIVRGLNRAGRSVLRRSPAHSPLKRYPPTLSSTISMIFSCCPHAPDLPTHDYGLDHIRLASSKQPGSASVAG
jgi:hypothetical protein